MPTNNVYKPNVNKMVCTCPYLATSHFLLCKHIVQGVLPVPPKFFLEVKQQREAPFWKHPSLKPLNTPTQIRDCESISHNLEQGHIQYLLDDIGRGDSDEDKDENFIDVGREDGQTFDEMVEEWTHTMQEFTDGLDYQLQFCDGHMLQALEHEGAGFKRLMTACLTKERRMKNTRLRGIHSLTWDGSRRQAMSCFTMQGRHMQTLNLTLVDQR